MTVKVGKLAKNKIVRDFTGQIIDWYDEARGGWIIQKRQIVNPGLWNEHIQKQKDKQEAAKAASMPKVDPNAPDRTTSPTQREADKKIEALEKEVSETNKKLDAILKALAK